MDNDFETILSSRDFNQLIDDINNPKLNRKLKKLMEGKSIFEVTMIDEFNDLYGVGDKELKRVELEDALIRHFGSLRYDMFPSWVEWDTGFEHPTTYKLGVKENWGCCDLSTDEEYLSPEDALLGFFIKYGTLKPERSFRNEDDYYFYMDNNYVAEMKEVVKEAMDLSRDLLDSIQRLNEELRERVEYEHKLLDIISQKDDEIRSLEYKLDHLTKQIATENGPLQEFLKDIEDSHKVDDYITNGIID